MTLIGPRAATKPPRSGAVGANHRTLGEHAINADYGTGAAAYRNSRADPPDPSWITTINTIANTNPPILAFIDTTVPRTPRPRANAMSPKAAMAISTRKYGGSL